MTEVGADFGLPRREFISLLYSITCSDLISLQIYLQSYEIDHENMSGTGTIILLAFAVNVLKNESLQQNFPHLHLPHKTISLLSILQLKFYRQNRPGSIEIEMTL